TRLVNVAQTGGPSGTLPVAVITADNDIGTAPFLVNFSGALSSTPEGEIVSYVWDFGIEEGGVTTSQDNISHVYNIPGSYVATLKVTNDSGKTSSYSYLVIVTTPANEIPVAKLNCQKDDKTFSCSAAGSF